MTGRSRAIDYCWEISPIRDEWGAAELYLNRAQHQPWLQKGPLRDRTDLPEHYRDIELWVNISGSPAEMKAAYDRVREEVGDARVAVHWYNWNIYPFDTNYPEYFPALEGSEKVIRRNHCQRRFRGAVHQRPLLGSSIAELSDRGHSGGGQKAFRRNSAGEIRPR